MPFLLTKMKQLYDKKPPAGTQRAVSGKEDQLQGTALILPQHRLMWFVKKTGSSYCLFRLLSARRRRRNIPCGHRQDRTRPYSGV